MRFYSPKLYVKDPAVWVNLIISFSFQVAMWVYLFTQLPPSTDSYFLHNTVVFGVDLIGGWKKLLLPLLVGLGVFVVDGVASFFLYGSRRFLARFLLFFMSLVEIGIAVAMYFLIGLNS